MKNNKVGLTYKIKTLSRKRKRVPLRNSQI